METIDSDDLLEKDTRNTGGLGRNLRLTMCLSRSSFPYRSTGAGLPYWNETCKVENIHRYKANLDKLRLGAEILRS